MNRSGIDEARRMRLTTSQRLWRVAQAGVELARESLQREIEAAVAEGARKAEIARCLGVTRQAIDEYLRWGRRKR